MAVLNRIPTWNIDADDELFPESAKPARKPTVVLGYAVIVGIGNQQRSAASKSLTLSMATELATSLKRRGTRDVKVVSRRNLLLPA